MKTWIVTSMGVIYTINADLLYVSDEGLQFKKGDIIIASFKQWDNWREDTLQHET